MSFFIHSPSPKVRKEAIIQAENSGISFGYVSGFFDADGSISLVNIHKNEHKSIQISFCNNEIEILKSIQQFLHTELNIKGAISVKKARKASHSNNFELKYTRNAALQLLEKIDSKHPKKRYRIAVALKYYKKVTMRNGKYNSQAHSRKEAFFRLFHWK